MDLDDVVGLGKVADNTLEATKELRSFLASIFGPLLGPVTEEIGQYIAEPIKIARYKRWMKFAEESQKQVASLGEAPQAIKPKILIPLMENSSLEDDEYLQEKWVNLLTSAAIGNDIHPSYPKILSELSSLDAKILEKMFVNHQSREAQRNRLRELKAIAIGAGFPGHSAKILADAFEIDKQSIEISLDNLRRLNLCFQQKNEINPQAIVDDKESYIRYLISPLGVNFVEAVRNNTLDN